MYKIVKEYKYSDLGIDIILKDIVLYKIGHEWLPRINIEKLSKRIFSIFLCRASVNNALHFEKRPLENIRNHLSLLL